MSLHPIDSNITNSSDKFNIFLKFIVTAFWPLTWSQVRPCHYMTNISWNEMKKQCRAKDAVMAATLVSVVKDQAVKWPPVSLRRSQGCHWCNSPSCRLPVGRSPDSWKFWFTAKVYQWECWLLIRWSSSPPNWSAFVKFVKMKNFTHLLSALHLPRL